MRLEIRTAALTDIQLQRVRRASVRARVHGREARVRPWSGTRCHVLVARADDAYGWKTLDLAVRRGIPVIALGEPVHDLGVVTYPHELSATDLSKAVHDLLVKRDADNPEQKSPPLAGKNGHSEIVLPSTRQQPICQLADPDLRGQAVDATRLGRTIMLRPATGRAYAASQSDFMLAAESFGNPGWKLRKSVSQPVVEQTASCSLESFLLRAAFAGNDRLPTFPDGAYRLHAWPDLGALPSMTSVMHMAQRLVSNAVTPTDLAEHCNVGSREVNACLWALAAADLLHDATPDTNVGVEDDRRREQKVSKGVWARLARRFGLSMK